MGTPRRGILEWIGIDDNSRILQLLRIFLEILGLSINGQSAMQEDRSANTCIAHSEARDQQPDADEI